MATGTEPEGAAEPDGATAGRIQEPECGRGGVSDRVEAVDDVSAPTHDLAVGGDTGTTVGSQGSGLHREGVEGPLVDGPDVAAAVVAVGSGHGVGVETFDALGQCPGVDADLLREFGDR